MADSDIFVRFGADIGPLKKGAEEASAKLRRFGGDTKQVTKDIAKLTAVATAAAAVVYKLASSAGQSARDLKNLSQISSTTTTKFQELAFGARAYGIEQDKLADIFKDTQDKVGDFIANGAGPLADFFDNIAPKVGVAANDFKNLSGPDALGLYVSSLEKANLSQNEMVFYMEAIASDATNLLPLLKNNGAEMERFGNMVKGAGIALSQVDVKNLDEMKSSLDASTGIVESLALKFGAELSPIIKDLSDRFQEAAIESGGFKDEAISAVEGVATAVGFVSNSFRGIEVAIKGAKIGFEGLSLGVNIFATKMVENIDWAVQQGMATINNLIDLANKIPGIDIGKLVVGKSTIAESMRAGLDEAKANMATSLVEMNALLMEPLPSETIEAYIASFTDPAILEAKQAQVNQFKAIDEQDAMERIAREEQTQSAMAQIRQAWGKQQTSAVSQMFGDLATLMQSGSKKQFEIGKAAARAQTVMSTYEGAQKAYTALAGIPIVGPGLGAAAAAAAIAAGGIRLQAINSTSFGGGGSVSAGGAGGAVSADSGGQAQAQAPAQDRTIRIEGFDSGQLFTGDQLNSLAEKLVEYQDDGFRLVV